MNYVLELLKSRLKDELIAEQSAKQAMQGNGFHMLKPTMDAFQESLRLARERIPQLEKAIKIIEKEESMVF